MQHPIVPTPVTLTLEELDQVLERVAPHGKEYGAARICRMLAAEHSVQTVRINTSCAVGNISDHVSKCINPKLSDLDLYVACEKPPYPINNRFGQPSGQMLWSFYRDSAANDSVFDRDDYLALKLQNDLARMKRDNPLLDMPDEEWIGALQRLPRGGIR
jgi:hypothetical protein